MWLMDGTRRIRLAMAWESKGGEECHHNKTKIKRHSFMVWDCWQAPEDSVSHGLWKQRLEGVPPKNKNVSWEPLFEGLSGKGVRVPTTIRWQQQTPLKTLLLWSLYDFKNSSTWFNPCFPLRRAFLLLYVESVYLLLSILEANTCVNCVHWFLHTCLFAFIILLCVDNYPWDIHVESWKQLLKLKSSFVLLQNLILRIYCFMS